ncbi:hypothetical protein M407DRAFT_244716 [Tulasnella calospora MUT 4182]|uniref:Uncharacterized protein n=1 Tax=Tulasnella calospora MUT 4182 TaxID=1051891 RepID=A0A0C3QDE8_9AGAM|nr:hypothetical protein M407DRAFT_244716 [Tulasnella calospora MUT 4182]
MVLGYTKAAAACIPRQDNRAHAVVVVPAAFIRACSASGQNTAVPSPISTPSESSIDTP